MAILVNRVAALRAELYTKTAADADRAVIPQYCLERNALRVVAPGAAQVAAPEKDGGPNTRPVV